MTVLASSAGASIQDPLSERLVPPATAARVQGEIAYNFDTTLNKGTAQYRTSLGSGNLFKRLLSISPQVHTLVVAYEFADRTGRQPPKAIQVTLVSDEYSSALDAGTDWSEPTPLLVIHLADSDVRYPVDVSQRTEVRSDARPQLYTGLDQNARVPRVQVNTGMVDVHVHRAASAWLPLGDFLALSSARELQGTVAGLDFHFSDHVLAGLRQFAAEMQQRPVVH